MRRSTIVVAFLAATVASAGAAPIKERLGAQAGVHSKISQKKVLTSASANNSQQRINAPYVASVPRGGSPSKNGSAAGWIAFRSGPQPQQPAATAPAPVKVVKVEHRSRKIASIRRFERQRVASIRKLASRSRPVSLQRDIEIPMPKTDVAAAPAGSIQAMVTAEARRAGVSPALAHAVVKVESRYQPNATGRGGYVGLMQLSYRTAQGMGFKGSRQALYQPSNNLTYGMRYLAQAVRLAGGSTCGAVSKYQGGHGVRGVTRAGAVYCAKVRRYMAEGIPSSGKVASN
ncbi:lytic transglycosylase domain-containing protein [Hansschlegelia quercus]|uniref:Lytic transglycosylase domain-containing protein n=1 Tax=Hansschlegelia quercus TaxID=2528245 RepID=A0A4Q9GDX2_9HYPH|nr:lytic transglycosylase domain-containing protein [Hansschlegelia quercus]